MKPNFRRQAHAIGKLLARLERWIDNYDRIEFNDAFAAQLLAAMSGMSREGLRLGLIAMPVGVGQGVALALERKS